MSKKQKTYTGHGIMECIDICKKYGLTKRNSDLHIKNPMDLNSPWTVIVKDPFI